jgi:hypothetical protein
VVKPEGDEDAPTGEDAEASGVVVGVDVATDAAEDGVADGTNVGVDGAGVSEVVGGTVEAVTKEEAEGGVSVDEEPGAVDESILEAVGEGEDGP